MRLFLRVSAPLMVAILFISWNLAGFREIASCCALEPAARSLTGASANDAGDGRLHSHGPTATVDPVARHAGHSAHGERVTHSAPALPESATTTAPATADPIADPGAAPQGHMEGDAEAAPLCGLLTCAATPLALLPAPAAPLARAFWSLEFSQNAVYLPTPSNQEFFRPPRA
ncbi:MAG: hypothetical protein LBO66_10730 [Deltaproteobacteria bacterium]|jgi:hypothetical protein|nr:hypothetical protein [Deltaproteobacteria bacterium]